MPLGKLGKYERVDVLGHGATGIVYLAWDTLLKKQIALKEVDLHAADLGRFLEEARVMDRLRHPNIVRVNGVDRIDGHVVIDMEFVKGSNLQQLLRSETRLPVDRALFVAIQVLDALAYAHQMRTVHRDIKPANILIDREDTVKLVDFGLAEILATNSYAGGAGTYAYMAPEDFAEEHHSDHQSDIWAVGVTLFEMLTGARPFVVSKPKDPFAWRHVLLTEAPGRLSEHLEDAPEGLQAVLDRALARDKRKRYDSAADFRDDLIAVRDERAPAHAVNATVRTLVTNTPLGRFETAPNPSPTLVAEPPPAPAAPPERAREKSRSLLPFRRKEAMPARVEVDPQAVHFGEVRKGDEPSVRLHFRQVDGSARPEAVVASAPGWVSVSPTVINRRKQALTLTARSDQVWETGDFQDSVALQTEAGVVRIPVAIRVLPPRRRFREVAHWLVPLFTSVVLPAATVAFLARFADARFLVPAAALASGLLAAMLLQVEAAADLGTEEKVAGGVILAVMTAVLGVVIGASRAGNVYGAIYPVIGVGVPLSALFLIQCFTRRHWKLWAALIVILALVTSYTFINALA